jgi:hypothetical protein
MNIHLAISNKLYIFDYQDGIEVVVKKWMSVSQYQLK